MRRHSLKQTKETKNLKYRYGITTEEKKEKIKNQGSVCAICREQFKNGLNTHVDHCHNTNKIRGILCANCNRGLGKFKDSPELLRFAALYIEYHAKQNQPTPIPIRSHQEGQDNAPHGNVHGARIGQDCDGAHHHIGGTEGGNPHRGTQASGGVGMGSGVSEVGTSMSSKGSESDWYAKAKADCIGKFVEYLCDESRELGMAIRAEQGVRLPNHRRELEIQGSVDEKVQSTEEAPKEFQEEADIDWNAVAARFTRPMESDWYTGFGSEVGDKPNKV